MTMMRFLTLSLAVLVTGACTQTSTPTGNPPPSDVGKLLVFARGDGIDVELDSSVAPLSIAATVVVDGPAITTAAELGSGATGRNLFTQKQTGNELRFAISDSRAIRTTAKGVLLHITLSGTSSRVQVKDISAADLEGRTLALTAFDGAPGSR